MRRLALALAACLAGPAASQERPPATASAHQAVSRLPTVVAAKTLDDFQLPPKTTFDRAMPRYPNVWFYIDASLAPSYDAAVRLLAYEVRAAMRLREMRGPFSNGEGSDADFRLEHLQPWEVAEHRALQHSHAFHLRYYHSALARHAVERVTLATPGGARAFYRVAASVHYEVEHSNPNHADVEICPICGRTGEYAGLEGNLVELVHDPLGLELLLDGTIRGDVVRFEDASQSDVGGIAAMRERFLVQQLVFPAQSGDRNTLRIGIVAIAPLPVFRDAAELARPLAFPRPAGGALIARRAVETSSPRRRARAPSPASRRHPAV